MTQPSDTGFAVTVRVGADGPVMVVCLAGEIDAAAAATLTEAADHLSSVATADIVVDLSEVTFACSTLPNFLDRVHRDLPTGSELTVCRPTPNTRWVLQATGMDRIAALRSDLPESAESPPSAPGRKFLPKARPRNGNRR